MVGRFRDILRYDIIYHNYRITINTLLKVGGIFYGWPAFIYVLKKEEVFFELCDVPLNGTDAAHEWGNMTIKSCIAQDTKYNSIFVTAALLSNVFGTVYGKSHC